MIELEDLFEKDAVNEFAALSWRPILSGSDKLEPYNYPNDSLNRLVEETLKRGEKYFYADPVDPEAGFYHCQFEPTEPRYEYRLKRSLTEHEYQWLLAAIKELGTFAILKYLGYKGETCDERS